MSTTNSNIDHQGEQPAGWGWRASNRDPKKFPWRIATLVLIFVASGLLYMLNTAGSRSQSEIDDQYRTIVQLREELRDLEIENSRMKDELDVLSDPDVVKIPLMNSGDDEEYALVYRNPHNQEVYLDPTSLPSTEPEMQYQLWLLTDEGSVDLGTVLTGDIGFQRMKNSDQDGRFLITLEPAGGSGQPDLERIVVEE